MTDRVDVLVCGAGMAGLCAGATAALTGARTLVVEKGPRPGGSMRMSGGTIWTAPSMAVMERYVPAGDRERQRQLVDGLAAGLDWLAGLGVPLGERIDNANQVGRGVDVAVLTDRLMEVITGNGGGVRTSTALERLEMDAAGRVTGATVRSTAGPRSRVESGAVVLATGGFGGNPELLARYVGRYADSMLRRANPHSVGDAFLAALAIGARTSPNLSTFYGHTMPVTDRPIPPERWTAVTQYASGDAILVNEHGERFFDESRSLADELAPLHIVQQPGGRAFLVMDRRVYEDEPLPGRSPQPMRPNLDNAVAAGGRTVTAHTLGALADGMAAWGVSRRGLLATIGDLNAALEAGEGADLRIPRTGSAFGVVEPPFRALAVRAGITFTLGGIDVDAGFHVLDRDGDPIPGLFAAGADAGGTYQAGYAGGLVLGLVQGRIAGAAAAGMTRVPTAAGEMG